MRLCAAILSYALLDPKWEPFLQTLEKAVDEYGIGEIMVHGFSATNFATYADYPKIRQTVDPQMLARFRAALQRFKRKGVKITLSDGEPGAPANLFDAYPEARNVSNGFFWEMVEKRTTEIFRLIPEAD